MMLGICCYDPINGEIISAARFKNPANHLSFIYDTHAKEFDRLENLPETQPERHRPLWKTDSRNDNDDNLDKERPLKKIAIILFIILPAGIIFFYLLVHVLRQCMMGCFY